LTLLELAVVLAIIGLLASIAIPRLLAFRGRAQQAEAKTALASVATSMKVYRSDNNAFTDDLLRIAWLPDGAPVYLVGFTSDGTPSASGRNDTAELRAAGAGTYRTHRMVDGFGNPLTESNLPAAPVAPLAFTIGAAGNLDDDPTLDQWTLDDGGTMTHVGDDNTN
jgi:type II secretory pathway pseudopilin PulG